MAKLSDKTTNAAWEDFRNHLIDCGLLLDHKKVNEQKFLREKGRQDLAKMAFKQGFVAGSLNIAAKEAITYHSNIKIVDDPEPKKGKITRNVENGRSNRNELARKTDNEQVEDILRINMGPMPLHEIIKEMKTRGALHWNNNNGSGFVKMAIKDGARIQKVERGIYAFDWEAN